MRVATHRSMPAAGIMRLPLAAMLALALVAFPPARPSRAASALPSGFQESVAFGGLVNPTALQFASDGRAFVAEKSGLVKVFDSLSDTTPTVFADLRTNVHNFWDRGLLGLALDPSFPTKPYVYVLYTHDAAIGGTAPRWGAANATSDGCPTPPGATGDGCVVSGRLSRLQAAGNTMTGAEKVLIEDWCQQYPSHSVGSLAFGSDGALYVSGGDGASFNFTDYGQDGNPLNPCGDPPVGVGGAQTPPTAEGGALRSQDLRTSGDPAGLGGTILRVDPATGDGLPGNPLSASADPNARRIVAQGLRNPFRIVARPGTNEIWIGDVGWNQWEEINRLASPTDAKVDNFGWPCYEGAARRADYDALNLQICEGLFAENGGVAAPYFAYRHDAKVVPGETCPVGSSSVAGVEFRFYQGGGYPDEYDGALFFADYSRDCIWAMLRGADGAPDRGRIRTFAAGAANPVNLQIGPGGDLFYVDFDGGTSRRIRYAAANQPPVAVAAAAPTSGPTPLAVAFDGAGSSDPDAGDALSYAWDLDGDGQYDDATSPQPSHTYAIPGTYTVGLRVTDGRGASGTDTIVIDAGNTPPTASIDSPASGATWRVGDTIAFAGSATDEQDGALPDAALSWSVVMHHCPSNCHTHPLQDFPGVESGSFAAPDHEYPSHLELRLTATDSNGSRDTQSLLLYPRTTELRFESSPSGMQLAVGNASASTPFTRTVIVGSTNSINAPSPQSLGGTSYEFQSWSDGGAQGRNVTAGESSGTYTATYRATTSATLSFAPAADARVQESSRSANYGASYLRADGGSDPDIESYLRFALTGVRGTVRSAKLRLYAYSGTANGPAVYATGTSWTETGITWSNRPARTGSASDDKGAIGANAWVEYDVTPLIIGDGTYGFALAPQSSDGVDFYSREHSNAPLRPQLVVTTGGAAGDTTPPDTTITSGPSGSVTSTSASFAFASTEAGSTFACSLDGGAYTACTSPTNYSALGSGGHTFAVRATDPAGNTDPTPASRAWTVGTGTGTALTFSPAADARVEEANASTNYGASTTLRVDGNADPDVQTYLRFEVGGVAGTVRTAKLRLYVTSATANGPAVFRAANNTWTETGVKWTGRPGSTGTASDNKAAVAAGAWVEYDVTALLPAGGNGTISLVLMPESGDGMDFHSREGANKPQLAVTVE